MKFNKRFFNNLEYRDFYGTIKKYSRNNKNKIRQEINWYLKIPDQIKIFTPRIIDYSLGENPYYEMEYYGYNQLGELYVKNKLSLSEWMNVIDKLLGLIELFKKYNRFIPYNNYYNIYYIKTIRRINLMLQNRYFYKLYNNATITINNKKYVNLSYYIKKLPVYIKLLYEKNNISIIHGDLCLSNILYDFNNRIIKIIDPRGSFGGLGIYGDIKYDLSKLRQSFVGFYDFIISDLFIIKYSGFNSFLFDIKNTNVNKCNDLDIKEYFDRKISGITNLENIKLIETLLFVSMIPFHEDNFKRQIAMYLTAVKKFNLIDFNKIG